MPSICTMFRSAGDSIIATAVAGIAGWELIPTFCNWFATNWEGVRAARVFSSATASSIDMDGGVCRTLYEGRVLLSHPSLLLLAATVLLWLMSSSSDMSIASWLSVLFSGERTGTCSLLVTSSKEIAPARRESVRLASSDAFWLPSSSVLELAGAPLVCWEITSPLIGGASCPVVGADDILSSFPVVASEDGTWLSFDDIVDTTASAHSGTVGFYGFTGALWPRVTRIWGRTPPTPPAVAGTRRENVDLPEPFTGTGRRRYLHRPPDRACEMCLCRRASL